MTGNRHAVLIASSSFPEEPALQPLTLPEKDVDGMHAVLSAPDLGGFTDTIVIKNRPHHEALREVNRVLKRADPDDFVLIYYSGHGKLDGAGRLYLATADTELSVLESTSIPVHSIRALIDVGQSSRTALILDCCYSGAIDHAFRGGVDDQLNLMSGGRGTFIMTASTGIQTAQEKEGDEFGLFTKHVINGIRSGEADRDGDGYITMSELYSYVHENVLREGAQEPMRWNINVRGELIVAKSGRVPREERRVQIRDLLFNLSREGSLPDRILTAALGVLAVPLPDLSGRLRLQDELLTKLAQGNIRIPDFIVGWIDLTQHAGQQPSPKVVVESVAAPIEILPPQPRTTVVSSAVDTIATTRHATPVGPSLPTVTWRSRKSSSYIRNIGVPALWSILTLAFTYLLASYMHDKQGYLYGSLIVLAIAIALFRGIARVLNAMGTTLFVMATVLTLYLGLVGSRSVPSQFALDLFRAINA